MACIHNYWQPLQHCTDEINNYSVVLVTLLPQPWKLRDIPASQKACQHDHDGLVMHIILDYLLHPLTNAQNGQFTTYSVNSHDRKCHIFLSRWIADYPEHVALHNHGYRLCLWCEVEQKKLGWCIDILEAHHDHICIKHCTKMPEQLCTMQMTL
jgi:hypothetical protein